MADIKLRAKLRAYGKLDISQNSLPHPTSADAGKFLGISTDGNYVLFDNATEAQIDEIINESDDVQSSKKSFIDSMF